jgi:hypothetical protein
VRRWWLWLLGSLLAVACIEITATVEVPCQMVLLVRDTTSRDSTGRRQDTVAVLVADTVSCPKRR